MNKNICKIQTKNGDVFMKTTGIVRRIDSLGRIVIPKEMRNSLRIMENDMLEIAVQNESIVLKKISTFSDSMNYFDEVLKLISKLYDCDTFITDSSVIYYYEGKNKDKYIGKNMSEYLLKCLKNRNVVKESNVSCLHIIDDEKESGLNCNYLLIPIIDSGDTYGILGFLNFDNVDNIMNIGKIIEKILKLKVSNI